MGDLGLNVPQGAGNSVFVKYISFGGIPQILLPVTCLGHLIVLLLVCSVQFCPLPVLYLPSYFIPHPVLYQYRFVLCASDARHRWFVRALLMLIFVKGMLLFQNGVCI